MQTLHRIVDTACLPVGIYVAQDVGAHVRQLIEFRIKLPCAAERNERKVIAASALIERSQPWYAIGRPSNRTMIICIRTPYVSSHVIIASCELTCCNDRQWTWMATPFRDASALRIVIRSVSACDRTAISLAVAGKRSASVIGVLSGSNGESCNRRRWP